MEEKNNVPELRFPEFSGVWEKHKLGDIEKEGKISLNRGNVIPKGDGPYPVYSSSVKNNGLMGYSNTYMFDRELVSWSIDGGGDFFYRPKHKFSVTNVSGYIDILDDTYLCYKYLAYELQFLHSFLHFDYQTKAHPSVIRELYTIAIPSVAEQEKIGAFISNLDNLIALHQRKLDDTKELKKCLLQKMFPKDGEDTPELRFPGFSVPWEQRKLGDVANSFEYGLNAAAKEFDGINKYIRITDIDDSTHEFLQSDLTSPDAVLEQADNYKLDDGDILFARTGASVGKTYIYKPSDGLVYYAGFLIRARINKKYDPEFIFQNTLTPDYDKYIRITSQRSGQPGVNAQEYADYELMIPGFGEQKKIGEFLRNTDNLIALHQRKLDDLKALKKCLLQEMFI